MEKKACKCKPHPFVLQGQKIIGLEERIKELENIDNRSIKFKKLDPEAKSPTRKHPTDAGMDVYSLEECVIPPHSHRVMRTGVTFEFPKNTVIFAWPKSRNEHVVGAGVIDCSYQGEILIKVINPYNYALLIAKNTGIAQLVITPVLYPAVEEADEIHEVKSERGDTGGIAGNS